MLQLLLVNRHASQLELEGLNWGVGPTRLDGQMFPMERRGDFFGADQGG